jgi:hypothetical protein
MEKVNKVTNEKDSNKDNSKDYEIPIGDNFKLHAKKKLGSGAFGDIYYGTNIKLNDEVAIKLEPIKAKHPQLFYEAKLYMALQGGGNKIVYYLFRKNKNKNKNKKSWYP